MKDYILVGDIGGTKTSLALYSRISGPYEPCMKETLSSRNFASLEEILTRYLNEKKVKISSVTLDVAGPIDEGRTQVTNLPWMVDEKAISHALGNIPVMLLNDLVATAVAIPFLKQQDYKQIKQGNPKPEGAIGVLSVGTGLGEAFLTWNGSGYQAHPSEGGHASFSPQTNIEQELLIFLLKRYDHVSFERVGSGMGLPNIYQFFADKYPSSEPAWLKTEIAKANDPTPIIIRSALDQTSSICQKVLQIFVSILGNEAGNLALKILATGGIYLAGGISPRIQSAFDQSFLRRFVQKGRLSTCLEQIPIFVVTKPELALFGAACLGLQHAS